MRDVSAVCYGLQNVSLRYFNVFGPAAGSGSRTPGVLSNSTPAIPRQTAPVVFGDGEQTRDFTYIENVVQANLSACEAPAASGGERSTSERETGFR